jgi:hypothetical protein
MLGRWRLAATPALLLNGWRRQCRHPPKRQIRSLRSAGLNRDAGQGLDFTAVNYYDGQGFLVKKAAKVASLEEMDGASIYIAQGTTSELNLADFFARTKCVTSRSPSRLPTR